MSVMTSTIRLAALPVAALALAGMLAACGDAASGHKHLARPANCADKLHAWGSSGGRRDVHAITRDTGKAGNDLPAVAAAFQNGSTSGSAKLAADGSRLSADAKAILAKPPPACTGQWMTKAMTRYHTAGTDLVTASAQAHRNHRHAAVSALKAGRTALGEGNREMSKARAAVNRISAGS